MHFAISMTCRLKDGNNWAALRWECLGCFHPQLSIVIIWKLLYVISYLSQPVNIDPRECELFISQHKLTPFSSDKLRSKREMEQRQGKQNPHDSCLCPLYLWAYFNRICLLLISFFSQEETTILWSLTLFWYYDIKWDKMRRNKV